MMEYTYTTPITELGALLAALYTGRWRSKKYDADIIIDSDEILVRQYFPGRQIVCSKIKADLFAEARLKGYLRRKIIENDPLNEQVFTLTRDIKQMEHVYRILATLPQGLQP